MWTHVDQNTESGWDGSVDDSSTPFNPLTHPTTPSAADISDSHAIVDTGDLLEDKEYPLVKHAP